MAAAAQFNLSNFGKIKDQVKKTKNDSKNVPSKITVVLRSKSSQSNILYKTRPKNSNGVGIRTIGGPGAKLFARKVSLSTDLCPTLYM